jgi:hypothetical protein
MTLLFTVPNQLKNIELFIAVVCSFFSIRVHTRDAILLREGPLHR